MAFELAGRLQHQVLAGDHRSDNVALLNLRVDKAFAIGKSKLTLMLDVDNALNANPVTNFNLLNDDFGHVIAVLALMHVVAASVIVTLLTSVRRTSWES